MLILYNLTDDIIILKQDTIKFVAVQTVLSQ